MLLLALLLVAIGGAAAEENDVFPENVQNCLEKSGANPWFFLSRVPEEEELLERCPKEVQYLKCMLDDMEKDGYSQEYMAFESKVYDFYRDFCEEDSELQKAYLANVGCYNTLRDEALSCLGLAKDVYRRSFSLLDHEEAEDIDADLISVEAMCMVYSVTIGCVSEKVKETCGADAYSTMMEIIEQSLYLGNYCTPELKNTFQTLLLPTLAEGEVGLDFYKRAFEIMKK